MIILSYFSTVMRIVLYCIALYSVAVHTCFIVLHIHVEEIYSLHLQFMFIVILCAIASIWGRWFRERQ